MLELSPNSKWQSTTVQVPTSNLLVAFETQPTASNQDALDSLVARRTSLFDFKRLWLLASFLCCVLYVVCTHPIPGMGTLQQCSLVVAPTMIQPQTKWV